MDKVKLVRFVGPRLFEVVSFETNVGKGPGGLYGGEIDADDFGARVLGTEIERPDSGSGTAVEDVGGVLATEVGGAEITPKD